MKTLKSKEAKKLIGKRVRWVEDWDAHRGDWKWLPDMCYLAEVKE